MSPDVEARTALFREFRDLFDRAGLKYVLIGGMAVNAWVEPRFTVDLDFVVLANARAIATAEEALARAGFKYLRRQDQGEPSGPDFVQMDRAIAPRVRVDIQVSKTPFQDGVILRAVPDSVSGLAVATPEDLIVLKLIAWRGKDQKDLAALLELEQLDWAYIEHWAKTWEVTERLAFARAAIHGFPGAPA